MMHLEWWGYALALAPLVVIIVIFCIAAICLGGYDPLEHMDDYPISSLDRAPREQPHS